MYSNYRRQGYNSRNDTKHLVQKPVNQVIKPMQILKRPDQASSGDKIISLPTLPNIKLKKEVNHVINSCTKPVIEISSVTSSASTKTSRRKPRNKDSKSSPVQSSAKQPSTTYHSDSPCSEKLHSSRTHSKSSRPSKEPLVDKKEDAAVKLLMVLLNSETSEQKPALSASPLKTSSKPRAQDEQVISPLSLLELLQPTPAPVKPSTKSYINYYAAPQFRKPPRLSELPVPSFLTV